MRIGQMKEIPVDGNRKETTPHGTYGLPLAAYRTQLSKNILGFVHWHWHEEVQFCRVTRGEVLFRVNTQNYTLAEGDGIFVNSGCIHMATPLSGPEAAYICLDAAPRLLCSFHGSRLESKYLKPLLTAPAFSALPLNRSIPWQTELLGVIDAVFAAFEAQEPYFEFAIHTHFLAMLRIMVQNIQPGPENRRAEAESLRLKAIFSHIHEHYAEELTLEGIAKAAFMSRSACCRFFKMATDMTLFQYVTEYRINRSLELLDLSERSVSDIAAAVGFDSTSYFIEQFRKRVGMSPGRYRKSLG